MKLPITKILYDKTTGELVVLIIDSETRKEIKYKEVGRIKLNANS